MIAAATPDPAAAPDPVLAVEDLRVEFQTLHGRVRAVNGVSYRLHRGETLGILGESGSGKSVSAAAVMGLIESPPGEVTGGRILYRGQDLVTASRAAARRVRGQKITMIFQDAITSLNPGLTVGYQIGEALHVHRGASRSEARRRAIELMDRVRIPAAARRVDDYPHQFSGGMNQRVMIAMALALDPEVLIADEPTTALDVTVQAQIMRLLLDLQAETGMAIVLITHDIGVVAEATDQVAVMYAGRVVESGPVGDIFARPAHPYTIGLMTSMPRLDHKDRRLQPIGGAPPVMTHIPQGCAFHPRCRWRKEPCAVEIPPLHTVAPGHGSACHFYREVTGERA